MRGKSPPSELVDIHTRNNAGTADRWGAFAEHRSRVTALALEAPAGLRLAVIGAGNGNDLDLPALLAHFAEVHLVDVDAAAVTRAVERAPATDRARLHRHAPVDVTGALDRLGGWRTKAPANGELAALAEAGIGVADALPGPFGVVLSTAVLSQLMWTCAAALGGDNPHLGPVASALVLGHLRALAALVEPGGTILLVVDTTSTNELPLGTLYDPAVPLAALAEAERSKRFFAGTNPGLLGAMLREDPLLAACFEPPTLVPPWLWPVSPDQTFLVYALVARARR